MIKQRAEQLKNQLKTIEGSDSPIVRWGVLLSVYLIVQQWLIDPYFEWRDETLQQLEANQHQIDSLTALKNSEEKWRNALTKSEQAMTATGQAFITASSYALAQQTMYNQVQELITRFQLKIDSQRLQEAKPAPFGEQIDLQLNLSGHLFDIISFLDALSSAEQVYRFEQLYISVNGEQASLRMTLSGFRLQTPESQPTQASAPTTDVSTTEAVADTELK